MSGRRIRKQKAAEKRRHREQEVKQKKILSKTLEHGRNTRHSAGSTGALPVVECMVSRGWRERGLAHILVARDVGDGHLRVGGYYVDTWCLGLKACAAFHRVSREEYETQIKPNIFNDPVELEAIEPGLARGIIEGAVEFAHQFGFRPGRRWEEARKVWHGIQKQGASLEFGMNGRPCLVLRPGENVQGAVARLQRKLKPGEYEIIDGQRLEEDGS